MLFSQSPVISAQLTMTVHVCGAASVQTVQDVFSDREKKRPSSFSLLSQSMDALFGFLFFSFLLNPVQGPDPGAESGQ